MNSFWGALLWGLLLVVYFAGARLKDARIKKNLNGILFFVAVLWMGGWLKALIHPIENPLKPSAALFFLHGSFLVAAGGMLFLVLAGSIAGLYFERKVFAPRSADSARAPSVEGIMNLCSWSLSLARRFWLLGTALAVLAVAVQVAHNHDSWSSVFGHWLADPAVWCVLAVAALLLASKFFLSGGLHLRALFRGYLVLACVSLITVGVVLWMEAGQANQGHIQKEFLR